VIPVRNCVPDVLAEVLQRQPLSPAKVAFAWRTAVGPAVERATRVTLSADGTLEVVAVDAHWQREVERSARLVGARLERLLGPGLVRRVSVSVAPSRGPSHR
jgi:hypothetical protein